MITVVLLAHPRPMLRVLRESISGEADLRVVGEAGRLDRALALGRRFRPEVMIVDAEMPGLDAVNAVSAICAQAPASAIVVISIEPDRLGPSIRGDSRVVVTGKIEGADALLSAIRAVGSTAAG